MKVYAIIILIVLNVVLWGGGCAHAPTKTAGVDASNRIVASTVVSDVVAERIAKANPFFRPEVGEIKNENTKIRGEAAIINKNLSDLETWGNGWQTKYIGEIKRFWSYRQRELFWIGVAILGAILLFVVIAPEVALDVGIKIFHVCTAFIFKGAWVLRQKIVDWFKKRKAAAEQAIATRAATAETVAAIRATQQVTALKIDEIHAATPTPPAAISGSIWTTPQL